MADLLGSILSSMEKPPSVGDQESRRKAREQAARLKKLQEQDRQQKAEFRKRMEKEVSDFIQDSGQVKKKFQPMNKIERSILLCPPEGEAGCSVGVEPDPVVPLSTGVCALRRRARVLPSWRGMGPPEGRGETQVEGAGPAAGGGGSPAGPRGSEPRQRLQGQVQPPHRQGGCQGRGPHAAGQQDLRLCACSQQEGHALHRRGHE
ncbi:sperm-associated antigen 7 isoform X2 [Mustela erminea]|uniref:sperm-associated antigen 7 isoform X2 n=1 Tax=Mustela erminea TaxID=36723 RepID=UPI001386D178|nr:sperm-associated antigen 7 isoform X2 [Mustela erminea]